MSALNTQPENKNMLSPTGFRFVLNRTPNVNYFTYSVPIPTLSLGEIDTENPNVRLPFPGDKLRYEPLSIRFRVDEDLNNYLEVYNWLTGIGFPEAFNQYAAVSANVPGSGEGIYSDGTLMILNSAKRPNVEVTFEDMYPTSMTDLNFTTTISDIDYLEASVTFRYKYYRIRKL